MTAQKHIKHIIMFVSTITVHWFVHCMQCVDVLSVAKLSTCPKPEGCLYSSPKTPDNFSEWNCLPRTLASPNPFPGIHKQEELAYETNGCRKYTCGATRFNALCQLSLPSMHLGTTFSLCPHKRDVARCSQPTQSSPPPHTHILNQTKSTCYRTYRTTSVLYRGACSHAYPPSNLLVPTSAEAKHRANQQNCSACTGVQRNRQQLQNRKQIPPFAKQCDTTKSDRTTIQIQPAP